MLFNLDNYHLNMNTLYSVTVILIDNSSIGINLRNKNCFFYFVFHSI